jgi:carboxypeptidase family protein
MMLTVRGCVRGLSALAMAMVVSGAMLFAQADARFTGTVLDQSGAAVAGATVVVKDEKTGQERTVLSNAEGRYLVTNLKPSVYTLRATFKDFAPLEYTGMQLVAAQEFSIDLELRPAGLTETVTVQGNFNVIDLSSARNGVNVSEREVLNLPVNGRQMSQLLLQAPGSQNAGTGTWQDIRFSGRAVEQNAIKYDGVDGSAVIDSAPGNLNGEVATPFKLQASLENVQEFRVESNSYPAEYGTGTGGQVSVITKSGSNRFSGALFGYIRRDTFDAPNYFDSTRNLDGSVQSELPKSKLDQNQFGGSFGGPLARNRAFFFGSYEGYRLKAGINVVEAVPSASAWARAVPAIAALRSNFLAPGAVILPGASTNPDFDIAQLQDVQHVNEDAYSLRLDLKMTPKWSSYVRLFHDQGTSTATESVSGRAQQVKANPTNVVFNLQGLMSDSAINDFKVGYNGAPTSISAALPSGGVDLSATLINLSGSVANTGIAGQGASSGIAAPGGLIRSNSAQNGRGQPYDPYSLTFADTFSYVSGNHFTKFGGEFRNIRMTTDRLGGTTYTFANITAFLNNTPTSVQYLGDASEPSVFNNGATGERHTRQSYYVAYAQDEWHASQNFTVNYGMRYDYYTPLTEADNLIVKFNIDTGVIDPNTTPLYTSKTNNFQPRVSMSYAPGSKTAIKAGFGIMVGPGQTEDQIQPVESDRISSTLSTGALQYPMNLDVLRANFINNPNTRQYQPRAFANDYTIPERVYQYTASVQRDLGGNTSATAAYVGSQGRNLFLRSVTNQITQVISNGAAAATIIREFDIVTRNADGSVASVQRPFAEIDYKTSGGHDQYNAMQLSLARRSASGLSMNAQYTLSKSTGNTAGSNEALTAGNIARRLEDFDYDEGYNNFDVRHTYNFSLLYDIPYGRGRKFGTTAGAVAETLLGGWSVGGILNGRSGLPIDVRITRPDVVYVDGIGNVFANPAADRVAVINTPGGGASRNVRRPDLVPGVDPFVKDGGLLFLNPAAFATPLPGTYGNLTRNELHGPNFKQVDLVLSKRFFTGGGSNVEFRTEVFNLFNTVNFANPVATLPQAIPTAALTEANRVQPGQPYTAAAAGTFGRLTSTVGRTVGLGTPRQVQFALRLSF